MVINQSSHFYRVNTKKDGVYWIQFIPRMFHSRDPYKKNTIRYSSNAMKALIENTMALRSPQHCKDTQTTYGLQVMYTARKWRAKDDTCIIDPKMYTLKKNYYMEEVIENIRGIEFPCMVNSAFCVNTLLKKIDTKYHRFLQNVSQPVDDQLSYYITDGNEKHLTQRQLLQRFQCINFQGTNGRKESFAKIIVSDASSSQVRIIHKKNTVSQKKKQAHDYVNQNLKLELNFISRSNSTHSVKNVKNVIILYGCGMSNYEVRKILSYLTPKDTLSNVLAAWDYEVARFENSGKNIEQYLSKLFERDRKYWASGLSPEKYLQHLILKMFQHSERFDRYPSPSYETSLRMRTHSLVSLREHISDALVRNKFDNKNKWKYNAVHSDEFVFSEVINSNFRKMITQRLRNSDTDDFSILVYKLIDSTLTKTISQSYGSNNWTLKSGRNKQLNVVEPVDRNTRMLMFTISSVLDSTISRDDKQAYLRDVNADQIGLICNVASPEGKNVGIVKLLSLMALIVIYASNPFLTYYIRKSKYIAAGPSGDFPNACKILGVIYCWCDAVKLGEELCALRRRQAINKFTSISIEENTLFIECIVGTLMRPVLSPGVVWQDLVGKSFIELEMEGKIIWISPREQEHSNISVEPMDGKYSEIHTMCHYSVPYLVNPLINHNPAVRQNYQTNMSKQVVTLVTDNMSGLKSSSKKLLFGTQPFLKTKLGDYVYDDRAFGAVLSSAVLMNAEAQEDSVVMAKAIIERFTYAYTKLSPYQITINTTTHNVRMEPCDHPVIGKWYNPGSEILTIVDINTGKKQSLYMNNVDCGVITSMTYERSKPSEMTIKLVVSEVRSIKEGDKFTPSNAQKGVLNVLENRDLPYLPKNGMEINYIMSIFAFSGRLTASTILEITASAKMLSEPKMSRYFDAFTVDGIKLKEWGDKNNDLIYKKFNIRENEENFGKVLSGFLYIHELKHHVDDKVQCRTDEGMSHPTYKTPIGGRRLGQAGKIGPMESDALKAWGAANTLKEKMSKTADEAKFLICKLCQEVSYCEEFCSNCKSESTNLRVTSQPFVTRRLDDMVGGQGYQLKTDLYESSEYEQTLQRILLGY